MDVFKNIIKKEKAKEGVLSFEPRPISLDLSESAKVYLNEENRKKSDFVMSDLMAKQTGVAEVESQAHKDKIEQEILDRLKVVQESTYKEAFALGSEEGSKQAFEAVKAELDIKIQEFGSLIEEMRRLRSEVLKHHEKEIVELVYQVGKKIAIKDLSVDSTVVKELIESIIEESEKDEEIKIFLSSTDHEFISKQIESGDFNFPDLQRLKLVIDGSIRSGGCFIQTKFGSIDSQVEQRVESTWLALKNRLPKTQDPIEEDSSMTASSESTPAQPESEAQDDSPLDSDPTDDSDGQDET